MNFAQKITLLRKRRGWTVRELAEKAGVGTGTAGGWCKEGIEPQPDSLLKLSELFDVSVDILLDDDAELPDSAIEAAAAGAAKKFPDNKEAGQAEFERALLAQKAGMTLRKQGKDLIKQGEELIKLADRLDPAGATATKVPIPHEFKVSKKVDGQIAAGKPDGTTGEDGSRRRHRRGS